MSRAFVKEPDGDEVADDLPERKISPHPNYVTPRGQQLLQEQLQHAEAERQRLQGKEEMSAKQALARVERDLRYLRQRVPQAILVIPPDNPSEQVCFGMWVEVLEGQIIRKFQIVGEDEALNKQQLISWVSPLAKAVLGAQVGDLVQWQKPGGSVELEILSLSYVSMN
ncbi:MAG: GreA/GreB family elongation factor [bacterium]